jgi:hypothetical protein
LYIWRESVEIISPFIALAIFKERAVFPLAVGPRRTRSGGCFDEWSAGPAWCFAVLRKVRIWVRRFITVSLFFPSEILNKYAFPFIFL